MSMDIRLWNQNRGAASRGLMPVSSRRYFGPHPAFGLEDFDDEADELAEMVAATIGAKPTLRTATKKGPSVLLTGKAGGAAAPAGIALAPGQSAASSSSSAGGVPMAYATGGGGPILATAVTKTYQTGKPGGAKGGATSGQQTAVARFGAGDFEKRQVASYNESKGLAPVVAVQVEALPPEPSGGLLGKLGEGLNQAMGGGGAGSIVGSLLGLGLGGPGLGSGPLPGALGRVSEGLFGTPGLPPGFVRDSYGNLVPSQYASDPQWGQLANAADYAGSTVARSLLGVVQPELSAVRSGIEGWVSQRQIADEAQRLADSMVFRREVLKRLAYIAGLLEDHRYATEGGGGSAPSRRYY